MLSGGALRKFERLVESARRYARLREQVVAPFTAGWPLVRRALLEIGLTLKDGGAIADEADVFFLTRAELEGAGDLKTHVEERKKLWQRQRRLTPPRLIGTAPRIWQLAQRIMPQGFGGAAKEDLPPGAVCGIPASPGRATGTARIVRGPQEFGRVRDGDVLIAPATAPAWTSIFARVAAVVTDTGSPMAHASLVAREYGIPAVVGTGDATRRFRDGELVTVDGAAGAAFAAT
jgi:rifampicin phosphotransferase